jgi:hypothetical protein
MDDAANSATSSHIVSVRNVLAAEFVQLGLQQLLVGELGPVLGDQGGRERAAARTLHDLLVLAGAKLHADAGRSRGFLTSRSSASR